MSITNQDQNKTTFSNNTILGNIIGQVHTGSGDITVFHESASGAVPTKDELLLALRTISRELELARQQGIPEEIVDDTMIEIEAAQREARKDEPKPRRIIDRLENARAMLIEGTKVVTASSTVAERLIPLIESTLRTVSRVF